MYIYNYMCNKFKLLLVHFNGVQISNICLQLSSSIWKHTPSGKGSWMQVSVKQSQSSKFGFAVPCEKPATWETENIDSKKCFEMRLNCSRIGLATKCSNTVDSYGLISRPEVV